MESTPERGGWRATVRIPNDCPAFQGHFEADPVLPGVAQLQLVVDVMVSVTGRSVFPRSVRSLKFRHKILPGQIVQVMLSQADGGASLSFRINNSAGTAASGTLVLANPGDQGRD